MVITSKTSNTQIVYLLKPYRFLLGKLFAGGIVRNIITLLLLLLANLLLSGLIANIIDYGVERESADTGSLISIVLFTPILETLLFQALPIHMTRTINRRSSFLMPVVISAVFFASQHLYSIGYFVVALGAGIILASFYVYLLKKKRYPIPVLFLVHAIYNGLLYLLFVGV